ncbi:MAG: hypothetical protein GXX93_11880 [Anaerolineae bacterium]|nr:hypothetical protein [Anaerolineae bacterium]
MTCEARAEGVLAAEAEPAGEEEQRRSALVDRRQVTLEDGRYLIYYTFDEKRSPRQSQ